MAERIYSKLAGELGTQKVSRSSIEVFSLKAPHCYKVYTIPKRTAGRRVIAHPSKKLKIYQKALVSILREKLIAHQSAYAYQVGRSIKDNAKMHMRGRYLLKMDFNDFFNSITPDIFLHQIEYANIRLSNAEKRLLIGLFFWNKTKSTDGKLVLSVGAPSSPMISNFVMREFDDAIYQYTMQNSITYTRYADDLTFSTNEKDILFNVPSFVKGVLGKIYAHQITINDTKTVFSSKAHNRHVTGITVTNDSTLSIGRERKRFISVMVHKYSINQLDNSDFSYLCGLLSFSAHIEPDFIQRLSRKYGQQVMNNLIKGMFNE